MLTSCFQEGTNVEIVAHDTNNPKLSLKSLVVSISSAKIGDWYI
jgi:hypothetical protein